jgi:hypothetical protein
VSGWYITFGISSAIYLLSSLPYLCCFAVKIEPWNDVPNSEDDMKVECSSSNQKENNSQYEHDENRATDTKSTYI